MRRYPYPCLFILCLATALRFYNLDGQSLWSDEGNSVALARRSFVEIAQRTAFDIHPPLYYGLLKIWLTFFGDSEIGLRSLSALLGVGLVYLIGLLGERLFTARVGLMAAFLAAFSPLQIYYAQEARMYMLLALLCTLTIYHNPLLNQKEGKGQWLFYIITVTTGLYTHYAYPLILVVVGLTILLSQPIRFFHFLIYSLIPLLLYLPWLPIAWRQITTWPSEKQTVPMTTMLETIANTLVFGLTCPFQMRFVAVFGIGLVILITLLILVALSRIRGGLGGVPHVLLLIWLILPIVLTIIIYSPSFLKFLIVATPAWTLLLALAINRLPTLFHLHTSYRALLQSVILFFLTAASMLSLYHYYTNPLYARDNYRGIVAFIKAVGGANDAVILNAEGQQDVFNYYYKKTSAPKPAVYPLPRQRPINESATLRELQKIAAHSDKIYAVYWATQQADPHGVIEQWLNSHLFKATDQWYGNVRLVSYASFSPNSAMTITPTDYQLGAHIHLTGYGLTSSQTRKITSGDILQLALIWQTDALLPNNYIFFGQILDKANHLVGQRDASPLVVPSAWPMDKPITDTHGIFIEPGTPPGQHRLIVGLYDSQSGQRLAVTDSLDFIELGQIEISRPTRPLPPEAFKMQVKSDISLGAITLLGYDLYKLGCRSTPNTPIHSGDPLQMVAYWQAHEPALTNDLLIQVVTMQGQITPISISVPVAGTDYPTTAWSSAEIIRAQYQLVLRGLEPGLYRLALTFNGATTLTKPFRLE